MSLAIFLTLLALIVALIYYYFKRSFSYFEPRGFLYAKPEIPFGNLKGVGTDFHFCQLSRSIYQKYKNKAKAVGLFFFTKPVVLLLDLDLIKDVLIKDFNIFHDHGTYINKEGDPLSATLFALEGAEWKNMRSNLSPTFTSGKMKMMYGTVLDIAKKMVTNLEENTAKVEEVEMNDILARYTTDVIGNVAFGLDLNSTKDPNSMFYVMGRKAFDPPSTEMLKLLFTTMFKRVATILNLRVFPKYITDFFSSSIKETIKYRETNNIVRNDFLNLLLELKNHGKLKDEDGAATNKITENELAAQAFIFYLAGFETSSMTMTFALYHLALSIDCQEILRNEIKDTIAKHGGQLTYETMLDMKYLHMVIDETLRMYPPIDLIRTAVDDYKIQDTNLTIEKGALIFIPSYAIQNDSDIYPEPHKFDPERFSDENKLKRHPMAHLPFGAGNRNCIGLRFAYMQVKLGLINLLLNFKFSPSKKTTIPMKLLPRSQVIAPIDRMWLNIERI